MQRPDQVFTTAPAALTAPQVAGHASGERAASSPTAMTSGSVLPESPAAEPQRSATSAAHPGAARWIWMGLLAAGFFLLYRINFEQLLSVWLNNPNFSLGLAIGPLAGWLVYLHWERLQQLPVERQALGLALLVFGVASQVLFLVCGQIQFSHMSMFVVLFGLVLWLLGWEHLKILWLPICYLVFMINPPQALYVKLTTPLQYISASLGVHLLPLFGIHAVRTATQINIQTGTQWQSLNVAEACSGIRLLTAFFALAIILAYSTNRPVWQKIILALWALPVAIFCNGLRVSVTGVLLLTLGPQWARGSTHADVGLLMLAPALLLQWGLARLIDAVGARWFVEDPASGRAAVRTAGGAEA